MLEEVLCINVPATRVGKVIGSRGERTRGSEHTWLYT